MKQGVKIVLLFLLGLWSCTKEEVLLFKPDFEVFVLLPAEGLGDRSFADVVYEGVEAATSDFNFKVNYIIPDNQEAGDAWIARIPGLQGETPGPYLIILAGNQYVEAVNQLERELNGHKVLLLAGIANERDDLASMVYHTYAPSYIAGYISAQLVPNCRAAVVEGFDAPFLKEYSHGFKDGVTDAGGTVGPTRFLSDGFSGFEMPDSAYKMTREILPEHDLLFALAAGSNFGIINAARDFPEQRYVVGVDSDQSWMGLNVVTGSVIKLFGEDIHDIIHQFSRGNFTQGNFYRTMEEGKTAFIKNELVTGNIDIPLSLIETAILKEKTYINQQSEE